MASEEIAQPKERSNGFGVLRHVPVVGIAQLIGVHFHHSGLNVEAHNQSVVCAQTSLVGVDLQLVTLQEGEDLSQVLGVLFPGLVEEDELVCRRLK